MNVFDETEKNVSHGEAQGVTEEVSKNQSESEVLEENEQSFVAEPEDQKTDESSEDEERAVEYYPNGKKCCERISRKGSSEVTMLRFYDDEVTISDIIIFENGKPTKITSFYPDGKKESESEYESVEDAFKISFFDEQGNFQEVVYIIGDRSVSKEEYEQAILKHKEQEETKDQEQSETKDLDEKVQETEIDDEEIAKAEEEARKKAEEENAKAEEEARKKAEEEKPKTEEEEREVFFAERGISQEELEFFDEYERRKRSLDFVLFGPTDEAKIKGSAGRKWKTTTEAEALWGKYSTYTSASSNYESSLRASALEEERKGAEEETRNDEERVKKEKSGKTEPGEE